MVTQEKVRVEISFQKTFKVRQPVEMLNHCNKKSTESISHMFYLLADALLLLQVVTTVLGRICLNFILDIMLFESFSKD